MGNNKPPLAFLFTENKMDAAGEMAVIE